MQKSENKYCLFEDLRYSLAMMILCPYFGVIAIQNASLGPFDFNFNLFTIICF